MSAFLQLRRSLTLERPDLTCLITTDGSIAKPEGLDASLSWASISRNTAAILSFFAQYAPRLCLWAGGWINPPLVQEADKRRIPLFLLDAHAEGIQNNL